MMMRIALFVVACATSMAAGADAIQAPLTPSPISAPELTIAGPARLATGSAGWILLPDKGVRIPGEGQSGTFQIAGEQVSITWAGERDFTISAGGKTQGLRPITRSYGLQPATITLSTGRRYTLAFPVGQVGRTPQGIQAAIFFRSGEAPTGTLEGETVSLYDVNTDGRYTKGDDGIRVGAPSRPMVFAPITHHFATSKGIYRIEEVAEDGSSIRCTPLEGRPAKLEVSFSSNTSEMHLILLSADEQMSAVASAGNKVRPPLLLLPGEYSVKYGVITTVPQGHITAVVLPASIKPVTLYDEGSESLAFGPPFKLEFKPVVQGMGIELQGESFTLTGKGGEQYVNYRWSAPPDITIQAGAASRRIGKLELDDGMLTEFTGQIPDGMGIGGRKLIITGVIEGLGPVRGEAMLD